jgi:hypothetical protein
MKIIISDLTLNFNDIKETVCFENTIVMSTEKKTYWLIFETPYIAQCQYDNLNICNMCDCKGTIIRDLVDIYDSNDRHYTRASEGKSSL